MRKSKRISFLKKDLFYWQPGDLLETHSFPSLPHDKFGFFNIDVVEV